jgi:predicted RNA-binding Zn-ribbon protein involved in translation (DUF1610 family)
MIENNQIAFRCKSCNAPLEVKEGQDVFQCNYCGTIQKTVDAREFIEEFRLSISQWFRQVLPMGVNTLNTTTDPVARHSIFVNNIQPILETEFNEYKFSMSTLLSRPMVVLPYLATWGDLPNDPKRVFQFQAKIESSKLLAISEDAEKLVGEAGAVTSAYAYLLNNANLMRENKKERYYLMSQNFNAAANSLKEIQTFPGLYERMSANAKISDAIDLMMNGKRTESNEQLKEFFDLMGTAKEKASTNISSAIMIQAIAQEMAAGRSVGYLNQIILQEFGNGALADVERVFRTINSIPRVSSNAFKVEEVTRFFSTAKLAQYGRDTVLMAPGQGDYLLPFWIVDLKYSFETGALWKKHGQEVQEMVLVAANAFTNGRGYNQPDSVTDVFGQRIRSGLLSQIAGNEMSISGGGAVQQAVRYASRSYASGRRVVIPLSDEADAMSAATEYINFVSSYERNVANKLRLSSPRVVGIVYLPAFFNGRDFLIPELGPLTPRCIGDTGFLFRLSI